MPVPVPRHVGRFGLAQLDNWACRAGPNRVGPSRAWAVPCWAAHGQLNLLGVVVDSTRTTKDTCSEGSMAVAGQPNGQPRSLPVT